jgi:hypothetical protein
MNIPKLYKEHNIHIATPSERHYREGWINTPCPFCKGNKGNHLGYNEKDDYFACHRCGFHSHYEVLQILCNVSKAEAFRLLKTLLPNTKKPPIKISHNTTKLILPSNLSPITGYHKKILEQRNFNIDELENIWGVRSTSPMSYANGKDYRNRIFFPIYWNGEIVSYDTRATTKDTTAKYKKANPEHELIPHKSIVFGRQELWGNTIIVVEGVLDAIKLKGYGIATFGTKYTKKQLKIIASLFKRVYIMYDNDEAGNLAGGKMKDELDFLGVENYRLVPKTDPGDMLEKEVNQLLLKIL